MSIYTFGILCLAAFLLWKLARWLFHKGAFQALNVLTEAEAQSKLESDSKSRQGAYSTRRMERTEPSNPAVTQPRKVAK